MLTDDIELISVDDHLVEPPDLWTTRLPAGMFDRAPRVVDLDDGGQQWSFEGVVAGPSGLSCAAGTSFEQRNREPKRFEEFRPGCIDPVARAADMDLAGIAMQLCFPSFPGFAGSRFIRADDKELATACIRAYNDFVLDEWCAAVPDRYIPLVLLPVWDIDASVAELHRTIGLGAKAVSLPDNPSFIGLPSLHSDLWNPLFDAVREAGVPVCMHFGSSGLTPQVDPAGPFAVEVTLLGISLFNSLSELAFSGLLQRHPGLDVVYAESGTGWFPYAVQRIDQVWEHYRYYDLDAIDAATRPSELIRQHVYACFIDDAVGIANRHLIGVENMLWESDYPHADSLWPHSRTVTADVLRDVPEDEVRLMVNGNARRLFDLTPGG